MSISGAALAAKNIKAALKKAFPNTKFSVRSSIFSGGNSIDISYEGGPEIAAVDEIADDYREGSFDGMTDSYNYRNDRREFQAENGSSMYIHAFRRAAKP